MRFKNAMSSVGGPEGRSTSMAPSLERDLPPTPTPTSPIPSFSDFQENYVPPWMRETTSAASTRRHSRASSIVSNLTRFTTASIDDARSIDIQVGGQNFRIARDASKITSEAPPPYSPAETQSRQHILEEIRPRSVPIRTPPSEASSEDSPHFPARPRLSTAMGANILDPTEVDIPSPVGDDEDATPPSTPRTSARTSESGGLSTSRLRNLSSKKPEQAEARHGLNRSLTIKPYQMHAAQRQRTDLPLLSTTSDALEMQGVRPPSTRMKHWQAMSAEDLALSHQPEPQPQHHHHHHHQEPLSPLTSAAQLQGFSLPARSAEHRVFTAARLRSDSGYSDEASSPSTTSTPSMDSENDISLHYARMIRFVDKQHRRVLHARDKEMEQLRERLAELDTVYRQQLKARDFIIEDLKKRLEHVEDGLERRLERARNEVEDIWEKRWKERDFHMRERMARIEREAGRDLGQSKEDLTGLGGEKEDKRRDGSAERGMGKS